MEKEREFLEWLEAYYETYRELCNESFREEYIHKKCVLSNVIIKYKEVFCDD